MSNTLKLSAKTFLAPREIPALGFGFYPSKTPEQTVRFALDAGYELYDSARYYRNEGALVSTISQKGKTTPWLTTKIWTSEHGTELSKAAIDRSVAIAEKFGFTWDLFLIHEPFSNKKKRIETWLALEQALKDKKIRYIGVSNYGIGHLEEIRNSDAEFFPAVNQIELNPWNQQKEIVAYCKKHNIQVQAYSPLTRGRHLKDPILLSVAKEAGKTAAQVLIRWSIQSGFAVVTKSDNPERIEAHSQVWGWTLTDSQMATLNALDQ